MIFRRKFIKTLIAASLTTILPGVAMADTKSKSAQRAEIRKMANKTLLRLYKTEPTSRQVIAKAAGYAVFHNFGMKIFLAGGGSGDGLVVDRANKRETFMKMIEVQAGIGFGIKKFSVIFVFQTHEALSNFIETGWEFSGQATAAATHQETGAAIQGAVPVGEHVWMYQLTDTGLALEVTAKGTKYYKNDELN